MSKGKYNYYKYFIEEEVVDHKQIKKVYWIMMKMRFRLFGITFWIAKSVADHYQDKQTAQAKCEEYNKRLESTRVYHNLISTYNAK